MKKILGITLLLILSACTNKNANHESQPEIILNAGEGIVTGSGDFGNVGPKDTKLVTIKIKNSGDEPLVGPPQLDNTNFSIAYQSGCASINPGKECTLKLAFKATGKLPGFHYANLSLDTVYIALSVQIIDPYQAPVISFSASPLDFGIIKDTQSLTKSLIITNNGSTTIEEQILVGPGFLYNKAYDNCSNKKIAPGKTCLVKLQLIGTGKSGAANDVLNFAGQGLLITGFVANSQGASVLDNPDVKLLINSQQVSSYDYGYLTGTQAKQVIINAKNLGNNISDNSSAYTLGGVNFQIVFNQCNNKALAPGASCQMRLVFSAAGKADGAYSDTLVFAGQSLTLNAAVGIEPAAPDIEGGEFNEIFNFSAVDTWTDIPGATVTIEPTGLNEKWEITYQGTADFNGTSPSNPMFGSFRIVDSSNNEIDNSTVLMSTLAQGGFYPNGRIIKITARDSVSTTKTYKLQARKGSSPGFIQFVKTNYTGALTNPDMSQKMFAVKVPQDSFYINGGEITDMLNYSTSWQDITGATVTVTPTASNQHVEVNFRGSLTINLYANIPGVASLRIVDSLNNPIDNAMAFMIDTQNLLFSSAVPVNLTARDIVSSPKTYKLQIRKNDSTWSGVFTNNFTGELTNPDVKAVFYAQVFPTAPTYINSAEIQNTIVNSQDTWVDVLGSEISINPTSSNEKWQLRFQGSVDFYSLADQNSAVGNVRIVDSDNNEIDNSTVAIIAQSFVAGSIIMQPVDLVARTVISTPKTYKLQIRKGMGTQQFRLVGGTNYNFISDWTDPDYSARFFAVKY